MSACPLTRCEDAHFADGTGASYFNTDAGTWALLFPAPGLPHYAVHGPNASRSFNNFPAAMEYLGAHL